MESYITRYNLSRSWKSRSGNQFQPRTKEEVDVDPLEASLPDIVRSMTRELNCTIHAVRGPLEVKEEKKKIKGESKVNFHERIFSDYFNLKSWYVGWLAVLPPHHQNKILFQQVIVRATKDGRVLCADQLVAVMCDCIDKHD